MCLAVSGVGDNHEIVYVNVSKPVIELRFQVYAEDDEFAPLALCSWTTH